MKDGPFFLTVFYSTTHFPYAAPAPYYGRFTDPAYRGRFKYFRPRGLGQEQPPDARDEQQIRGLYDGAVASIDDATKALLDVLGDEKLASNTIVIVTADHGETLYDHGHGAGHGDHLFGDEGTHVPLFVFESARLASGPRAEHRPRRRPCTDDLRSDRRRRARRSRRPIARPRPSRGTRSRQRSRTPRPASGSPKTSRRSPRRGASPTRASRG